MDTICDIKIPWGIKIIQSLGLCAGTRRRLLYVYRSFILLLTFLAYTSYHMSRKPISVVKPKLLDCGPNNTHICTSWISEMNNKTYAHAKSLEGVLDTTYLFSYAFFMFFSGFVAERVNLRYFLSGGMLMSGLLTFLFGAAKYMGVHTISYFIVVQIICGAFQSTGWPGVVTVVANWFGKGKKGLIFGIWNSHTSLGNIAGSVLAGVFVDDDWGLSFIVPGMIIGSMGFILWLFLVPHPEDVELTAGTLSASPSEAEVIVRHRRPSGSSTSSGERSPLLSSNEDVIPEESFGTNEETLGSTDTQPLVPNEDADAITFLSALKIPGVIEFSMCLFFAKLVSYTFLYWLPTFIMETGRHVDADDAAYLSTLFDIGGIAGGMLAGFISDRTGKNASTCAAMLIAAIPMLFVYQSYGNHCPLDMSHRGHCYTGNILLLLAVGFMVNGPYALITTAVSAELGMHPSLHGSAKALATVTAIIDGTGSIGAAIGPLIAGSLSTLKATFVMLMLADIFALLFLTRLVVGDVRRFRAHRQSSRRSDAYAATG